MPSPDATGAADAAETPAPAGTQARGAARGASGGRFARTDHLLQTVAAELRRERRLLDGRRGRRRPLSGPSASGPGRS